MTVIVDYKAGNLTSVRNAFAAIGAETVVSDDPAVIRSADRVVFPGVGAAASAMANLKALKLEGALADVIRTGHPFLGICLGMQILFEHSEEDGGVDLLGFLPGQVRRFPDVPGFKVPEIGWNSVDAKSVRVPVDAVSHRVREEVVSVLIGRGKDSASTGRGKDSASTGRGKDSASTGRDEDIASTVKEYYFVHSYYAEMGPYTVGTTEYAGVTFTSAVKKGNLTAYQFHPEKSGRVGLELLKEWLCCANV